MEYYSTLFKKKGQGHSGTCYHMDEPRGHLSK